MAQMSSLIATQRERIGSRMEELIMKDHDQQNYIFL
jgi:hypothetical protein